MISRKKNTYNSCDRNLNKKRLINNFYDYNEYKRVIVNDAINNNDDYKTRENSNRKELKSLNSSNNNSKLENEYCKSKMNSIKPKRRTEISTNYFYLLNNKYKNGVNTQKNLNINSNNQNLNSIQMNDSKNNITDIINIQDEKTNNITIKNGKQKNINKTKKNISNTERGEREGKIKNLDILNKFNQVDGYLSKKLSKKRYYNYKPNIYKPIVKNDDHKKMEKINLKPNNISENIEEPNINYLIGIFHKDKMNFFDGKEELNKYKIMKLTNPVIFEDNNLNKINPRCSNIKEELNKNKYTKKKINNQTIDFIDDSNNIFNNYMKKNEKRQGIFPLPFF
jgi:kinetochore protein NDC80